MYAYLKEKFNETIANILYGLWYFFLLMLIITLSGEEHGMFRYLGW